MKKRVFLLILFIMAVAGKAEAQPEAPTGDPAQTFCSGALVSGLVALGDDIKWYANPSGGSPLDGSAILIDATHYYASQTVSTLESTDRLDVLVTIDLPSITGTLTICGTGTSTLTGSGTPAASNPWISGTPGVATVDDAGIVTGVSAGTSLITYTDDNGCIGTTTVTITNPAAPSGSATQSFCTGATVADLAATGTDIKWYAAASGGVPLLPADLLTPTDYYASQTESGCEGSNRLHVVVTINALPAAPGGSAAQSFCTGSTVDDLVATGSGIKWYSVASGGTALLPGTVLSTASYYASQTTSCEGTDRLAVAVTLNLLPVISGTPSVCVGSTVTLTGSVAPAASTPWFSAITSVATISDAGVVTGISAGSSLITYTDINGCSNSVLLNVHARPLPMITGSNAVCVGSTGNIYSTAAGMTNYQWSVGAGGNITSGGNTGDRTVTVTWTTSGSKTVSVNYTDLNGCTAAASTVYNVNVESGVASNVAFTGSMTVGGKLTATYDFNSPDCFPNNRTLTKYTWYRSSHDDKTPSTDFSIKIGDSTLVLASGEDANYIQVQVQIFDGSFYKTAVAGTWSAGKVAGNSKPVASAITISGTLIVNEYLTGGFTYTDDENDAAASAGYQWFRSDDINGTIRGRITGATSGTYKLTAADGGKYIGLKILPKATTGTLLGDTATMASPWYGPVVANAPVVSNLRVLGSVKSGLTIFSSYDYYDVEGDLQGSSIVKWYRADNAAGTTGKVLLATSSSYKITDAELGKYVGFSVEPVALTGVTPGNLVTLSTFAGVVNNDAPSASNASVSSGPSLNVNDIITGSYDYTDNEGDLQGTSVFEWWRSPNATLASATKITSATSISYQLTLADTGKYIFFKVTPKAKTGTLTGSQVSSIATSKVNTPPYAVVSAVTGTMEVGQILTGHYVYHDGDGNSESGSTYRWLRSGSPISLATSITYTIAYEDEGSTLSFEVTPKSSSGFPNIGNPVVSAPTGVVANTSTAVPVASEVCIQGRRDVGAVLNGKYRYDFPSKAEGSSTLRWLRGTPSSNTEIGLGLTYTLTSLDLNETEDIYFEVTPKSGTPVKTGLAVMSYPLARITLPQDHYSSLVDTVILEANVTGGVFSGPGVTNRIFSPKTVGDSTVPYRIEYFYDTVNATTVCTQEAFKDVTVDPSGSYFDGYPDFIFACQEGGLIKIQVGGIDTTGFDRESYGFYIYTYGSYYDSYNWEAIVGGPGQYQKWTAFLDPSKMKPGKYIDELYFYYVRDGYWNWISKPIEIEMVRTASAISNLKDAYCKEDGTVNISVEGLYPAGGTSTWTGDILTDKDKPVAVLHPASAVTGTEYPITYQYETENGCLSAILTDKVTINAMPVPLFNLNPSYNIEGDAFTLVGSLAPGGSFIGDGVSVNRFFPDIAGLGDHVITYKIVDVNSCKAESTKSTTVRNALGSFVNLDPVICYRDTTYNISTTGLPGSITMLDFSNSGKSLVPAADLRSASYNIKYAGAGYDTITLSYKWDDVIYSISKVVYIDSIGKMVITGLKDNYCDYDGTATLRVLVENSTGSGNFSFSGPDSSFTNYGPLADFYPAKTPSSADPYLVTYTHVSSVNSSGCRKKVVIPVTINKSPSVTIFNDRTTVNIKEPPITLNGDPDEGIFSGKGVYLSGSRYVFDPKVAGLGNIEITMSYTDSEGCLATGKDILRVEEASGEILGVNTGNQYCYDGLSDTLKYSSAKPWFSGAFSGAGVTNIGSAKALFTPSAAGKGDHEISFTYSDADGTIFDVSQVVNVDSLGQIEIKADGFFPGAELCNNTDPFELYVSHKGGLFDGPVISGSLDPSRAIGDTAVIYTYTNQKTGCFITGRVPFTILTAPVISFATADVCIENAVDSITFVNNTTSANAVSTWEWGFSDVGGTDGSDKKNPRYLFKTGGQHLVTLTATSNNGCSETKTSTIDIGIKPVADFHWKNECFLSNSEDSLFLFDATASTSAIISRSWNFFGEGIYGVDDTIRYPKEAVGFIPVEYIVRTKYPNCDDRILKNIFIRPTVKLTNDNYFENFESGNGGWAKDDESLNSWSFGTPDRSVINSAASGINAWYTNFDISNQKPESSSIVSPCFDFTETDRPMINLRMWKHFDMNRDGAALQYKIGDIGSWQYIGSLDDGINWYNSTLIKGRPGGDQVGWTTIGTPDNQWVEARHNLDELKGRKDVKFRIVYGSEGNSQNNDGLAFDDILIGERTRNVLIEHFSNYSSRASSEATGMIDAFALSNKEDIINIQYHTNFPGIDSFYLDNPGDASARILFYGLTRAPYAFIDGGTGNYASIFDFTDKELDGSLVNIDVNEISRRTLINPVFDINLDPPVITGGVLQLGGRLTALQGLNSDNLTLYLVVTESVNSDYTGTGGVNTFHNVFRKFIPDAGGIDLKKSWVKGDEITFPDQTWVIEKTLNSSDIDIIAFIQDNVSKEVFQAVSVPETNISVGIDRPGKAVNAGFALYPNPATAQLTIEFGELTDSDLTINIYDFRGAVIRTYTVPSGEFVYVIDDLGLPDGIYLIRVTAGGIDYGFKKLIVTGS